MDAALPIALPVTFSQSCVWNFQISQFNEFSIGYKLFPNRKLTALPRFSRKFVTASPYSLFKELRSAHFDQYR
jgi:hypothetical protein